MNPNLNENERELIKLANYFSKNAERLLIEEKIGEEHKNLVESCKQIVAALNNHADYRATILEQREAMNHVIKDNAHCPKCNQVDQLKKTGVDSSQDIKCNTYKCRKCNISFVWNRPNNPWDFLKFIDRLQIQVLEKMQVDNIQEQEIGMYQQMLTDLAAQRAKLQESVTQVDENYSVMQQKEAEMAGLVNSFSKYLKITKIQMADEV